MFHRSRGSAVLVPALGLMALALAMGPVGVAANDDMAGSPCVGTWLLRVTSLAQPEGPGFPVNASFLSDGVFITEGAPVSPGPADAPEKVTVMSTAQGVWQPTETGCAVNHVFYNADLLGNLVNTVEIRIAFEVGPDGDTLNSVGPDYATVTAPDGSVLFSGPGNTVGGTRLVLKLAPSMSPSPAP